MKKHLKYITPPLLLLCHRFREHHGFFPNLINPKTFSEKIALRMRKPKPLYSLLADKIAVRDYVRQHVGDEYLVPLFWEGKILTEEIWNKLPDSFVLKANHASGTNLIVRSKKDYSFEEVVEQTQKWLATDFSKVNLEKHYKYINRKLLAEQLLTTKLGQIPYDYKVHCFNSREGTRFYIQVDYDRFVDDGDAHTRDFFDEEWNFVPFTLDFNNSNIPAEKPACLKEILLLSKKLCGDLAYSRIDWYILDDRPLFGEITLTHGCSGEIFTPYSYDELWGALWDEHYERDNESLNRDKKC